MDIAILTTVATSLPTIYANIQKFTKAHDNSLSPYDQQLIKAIERRIKGLNLPLEQFLGKPESGIIKPALEAAIQVINDVHAYLTFE